MTRQEAAAVLKHYAILLELTEGDSFRARAFANASRMLDAQSEPLDELIRDKRLEKIPGIGRGVAAAIVELHERGTFEDLETVRNAVPEGVLDLLKVEGLGPKKVRALWLEAKITSLSELAQALESKTLPKIPGVGAKTQEKLLDGVRFLQKQEGKCRRDHAHAGVELLRDALSRIEGIEEIFFGGSFRRGCETVSDLDVLLVAPENRHKEIRKLVGQPGSIQWKDTTEHVMTGRLSCGVDVELSVVSPQEAPLAKLLCTGSKEHLKALQAAAGKAGVKLAHSDKRIKTAKSEAEIYELLDLKPVPAPLRESAATVLPAEKGSFPEPVRMEDIRGIIHNHSNYSDGHHTLRELAEAMIEAGYEYLGIADHSQAAAYANGMSPETVRRQWREIDELNQELTPFRILKGVEADILADGSLDYDDELLSGFDYVVGSIHSGFKMTEAAATERLCRALENPRLDILGHPTGRLLLARAGYTIDHETVIKCTAAYGKAIELNANPHRLDIDWRWLAMCEEAGVPVPICPDAHSIDGLWDIRYGIETAAKGPLTAANCPSTWSAEKFLEWCRSHEQ